MLKKYLLLSAILFIGVNAEAQRMSFSDFFSLVKLTVDDPSYPIMGINDFLRKNSEDWNKPSKEEKEDGEIAITWPYKVQDALMGQFIATFRPFKTGKYEGKASLLFPYRDQYDDYLKEVSAASKLVNSFTRNGDSYRIYESAHYTWAFVIFPASSKTFYLDGVATQAYMIEAHHIL